jgi:putative CocE/NonD family hydrolase
MTTNTTRAATPSRPSRLRVMALAGLACAGLAAVVVAAAGQDPPRAIVIDDTVMAKMRDGVRLAATVYRPADADRLPTLVTRTPYDRRNDAAEARKLAAHGYLVVVQDTRGRFGSEGEFYPFRNEGADGYDTVEWAAALPHSDGRVGMYGSSYVGATQMLAAVATPPHLAAIAPGVTASEYYEGWTYQGGALAYWFTSTWASLLAIDTLDRQALDRLKPAPWVQRLPIGAYPVLDLPDARQLAPYYRDWLEHDRQDEYWRRWKVSDHYGDVAVPALHTTGWYDLFLAGAIENFNGLRAKAATARARGAQRIEIGPRAHPGVRPDGTVGEVAFGQAAVTDETADLMDWFDFAIKGVKNRYATGPPVRIFVMGDNVWRAEQEFPPARARLTRYYLHAERGANGVAGDGRLATAAPTDERPDAFTYDPANPVPTIGGRLCCGAFTRPGPADQRPNELRADVLVYSTPALDRDLEVTGNVSVELFAASSAADTDFTAMLVDVEPSGLARLVADGIVRARYRRSTTKAEAIVPGETNRYVIDLWATSNVFKAGHRIRLDVSSSNFPRFDRNLNTGEPILVATRAVTARQTVYHDDARLSALVLPVIR